MRGSQNADVKIAVCDQEAFYPLRDLVSGRLESLDDLTAVERFIRTVVLHDEIEMMLTPNAYNPDADEGFTEEERKAGVRLVITGMGPTTRGYDFFQEAGRPFVVPEIELSLRLLEVASEFANAGAGNVFYKSHVDFLKRALGVVRAGGSVLLCGEFGQKAIETTQKYPELLFKQLDEDWQKVAQSAQRDGLGFIVPPVLGIVLSRCAKREAIPTVIRDLRDEWAVPRKKIWHLLCDMKKSQTVAEFTKAERELAEASRLFSPEQTEFDSRPIRILWEIVMGGAAGALVAKITGVSPALGAATAAIAKTGGSSASFAHDFGTVLFGRGAFDLAKRIRREIKQSELGALSRLLTDSEKSKLGL